MKDISKCGAIKAFIAPKMTYLIAYVVNHGKEELYYGSDINYLYNYLGMVRSPTTLTHSSQHYHYFGPKTNTDSVSTHPVIVSLRGIQIIIYDCCLRPGHKTHYCIIRGPDFSPPIILRKKNQ